eukprot:TRINITY_DN606_c0_g1_i3.p1 TRINITY_DN606_c0_g1~~TRINITY_DN606_c0_g1_i3.p1  ORF type:complete len:229 (+),score=23.36 TRINITY_DN606_c0_g1_i3:614-1300(+)
MVAHLFGGCGALRLSVERCLEALHAPAAAQQLQLHARGAHERHALAAHHHLLHVAERLHRRQRPAQQTAYRTAFIKSHMDCLLSFKREEREECCTWTLLSVCIAASGLRRMEFNKCRTDSVSSFKNEKEVLHMDVAERPHRRQRPAQRATECSSTSATWTAAYLSSERGREESAAYGRPKAQCSPSAIWTAYCHSSERKRCCIWTGGRWTERLLSFGRGSSVLHVSAA